MTDRFKKLIKECNGDYSLSNEDTKLYDPGWKNPRKRSSSLFSRRRRKAKRSPWQYASGGEARSRVPVWALFNTYFGGGYLSELGDTEKYAKTYYNYLFKHLWADKYTKAIFVEFTLFNMNLNLMAVASISVEFPTYGGAFPKAEVFVSRLYRTLYSAHMVFVACDVLLFLIIFYSIYREGKKIKQLKKAYFKEVGNVLNFLFIFLGFALMGTYIVRAFSLDSKIEEFIKNPTLFISFYQNAMYHETVCYIMAATDFLAVLKFLTFMSFNRNFILLTETVKRAAPKIIVFFIFFGLHILAYMSAGHMLFGAHRYAFKDVQTSLYTIFQMLLGVFDKRDFSSVPYLGRLYFYVFVVVMTVMIMNIFMTILMEVFALVSADEELKKLEYKLVDFLKYKIKLIMGLEKKPVRGAQKKADDEEKSPEEEKKRKKCKRRGLEKYISEDPFLYKLDEMVQTVYWNEPMITELLNSVYADEFTEDLGLAGSALTKYSGVSYKELRINAKVIERRYKRSKDKKIDKNDLMSPKMSPKPSTNNLSGLGLNLKDFGRRRSKQQDSSVSSYSNNIIAQSNVQNNDEMNNKGVNINRAETKTPNDILKHNEPVVGDSKVELESKVDNGAGSESVDLSQADGKAVASGMQDQRRHRRKSRISQNRSDLPELTEHMLTASPGQVPSSRKSRRRSSLNTVLDSSGESRLNDDENKKENTMDNPKEEDLLNSHTRPNDGSVSRSRHSGNEEKLRRRRHSSHVTNNSSSATREKSSRTRKHSAQVNYPSSDA